MIIHRSKQFVSKAAQAAQRENESMAKELLKHNPYMSSNDLITRIRQQRGAACDGSIKKIYMAHRRTLSPNHVIVTGGTTS